MVLKLFKDWLQKLPPEQLSDLLCKALTDVNQYCYIALIDDDSNEEITLRKGRFVDLSQVCPLKSLSIDDIQKCFSSMQSYVEKLSNKVVPNFCLKDMIENIKNIQFVVPILRCPILYGIIKNPGILIPCGHTISYSSFPKSSVSEYKTVKCPYCATEYIGLAEDEMIENTPIARIIDELVKLFVAYILGNQQNCPPEDLANALCNFSEHKQTEMLSIFPADRRREILDVFIPERRVIILHHFSPKMQEEIIAY